MKKARLVKHISIALALFTTAVMIMMIAVACGNDTNSDGNLYILEAESMDLSNYYGLADSASPSGASAILGVNSDAPQTCLDSLNKKKADGSNYNDGYFVGFFNGASNKFVFTFESDADATASFSLRLGSENGNCKFNSDNLTVKVNDAEIAFNEFTVSGPSGRKWGAFKDYEISSEINLRKNDLTGENDNVIVDGEVKISRPERVKNIIEITLGYNDYWAQYTAGGFGIDCLKLNTSANITWDDYWVGGWAIDWDIDENAAITQVGNKDQMGGL